jgi:hypothetical protein
MKKLALMFMILFLLYARISNAQQKVQVGKPDTSKLGVAISPDRPLIEKDIYGYYMNFDITIKNPTSHTLELSSIEAAIMDDKGKLAVRKFINSEGNAPGSEILTYTVVKPGETVTLLNPCHTFSPDVTIGSVKYGFYFNYADNDQQKELNKKRLPIDYDMSVVKAITPKVYIAKNDYFLPLKGKIIVWDGHDFYSHNRRSNLEISDPTLKQITANSSRYAYDLMSVDANGNMYSGSPYKKESWYSYGQPVIAPSEGTVVALQSSIPDNEYDGKMVKSPKLDAKADPEGMGNYVIIQHANGEYSMLLHLKPGSIPVRVGEQVKAGELLGLVGFSGSAFYPHLHYSVTNGAKELAAEGLPNYFNDYKLFRGNNVMSIKRSRIDSGDIVESEK